MITHMQVNVKKLHENAVLPTYGSTNAAGADLYACIDSISFLTLIKSKTPKFL